MNKLILPITTSDLNLLINSRSTAYDKVLGAGIPQILMVKVVTPLILLLPVYTEVFNDDDETEDLNELIKTIAGLWQLKVLANLGETYIQKLHEYFGDASTELDQLTLAYRVNLAMPAGAYGLETTTIFHSASSIMGTGLWSYQPTSQTIPEVRVPSHHINLITYSLLQILTAVCFRLTTVVTLYCHTREHKHLQSLLMNLNKAVRDNADLDFEPLLEFISLTDSLLIETRRNLRDNKVKSLNLRVIK